MSDAVRISEAFSIGIGCSYAVMSHGGYVDATVEYYVNSEGRENVAVYAALNQVPSDVALANSGVTSAEFTQLLDTGRLVTQYDLQLLSRAQKLFRIEDYVNNCAWMVSFDSFHPGFRFGQVYVHQLNGQSNPGMRVAPPDSFQSEKELWGYVKSHPANQVVRVDTYYVASGGILDTPPDSDLLVVMDVGRVVRDQ